jgi:hypothetical protein
MHYVAGALLIAQFVLMWTGDESQESSGCLGTAEEAETGRWHSG